jgi:hypothetical protein
MTNPIRALPVLLLLPLLAQAHEGHGASGAHLHPAEALGLVVLAAIVIVVIARFWKK